MIFARILNNRMVANFLSIAVVVSIQGCSLFEQIGLALRRNCDRAVYTVNTIEDRFDAICTPEDCSLRDAFSTAHDCGGAHTIRLGDRRFYALDAAIRPEEGTTGRSALRPVVAAIVLEGNGSTIRAADGGDFRFIEVLEGGHLTTQNVAFDGGREPDSGGAIRNSGGTLTIIDSTFNNNVSRIGGAIFNLGDLTVSGSLFSANVAPGVSGGGAIYADAGSVSIRTSTFSANSAVFGAAIIFNDNHGLGEIRDTTFAENVTRPGREAAGVLNALNDTGPFRIVNSAFQSGAGPNCFFAPSANVMIRRQSMASDTSCGFSMTASNLMLGPLSDIGGPTRGHAPLAASPLIDAGPASSSATGTNACLPADQRGIARPQGVACDIGSIEVR